MIRRNAFTFTILILAINFGFGVYLLGQKRSDGGQADYYKNVSYFGSVLEMVKSNYVEGDVDLEKLTQAAIDGMLSSLDPHSELLIPSKYEDLQAQTRQQYGGIGVQIERRNERITVIAPIAGTPGEAAGVMPGDQIISVNDENAENMSLEDIVEVLRGKPKSEVSITFFRPKTGEMVKKSIVREVIRVESVRGTRLLEDGIGYIQITQFGDRTGKEFLEAVQSLEAQDMRGLVIDLRNNPGGLLTASVEVAEVFFTKKELVVYTQGSRPNDRHEIYAKGADRKREYPIAILINSGSASASEIVAGAMQDTERAVIVGETSFGKGSVQSILPLGRKNEALRLTTAKYYTPSGRVIHEHGVGPDIVVELPIEDEVKLRVQRNRPELTNPEEFMVRFGFAPIQDRQLQTAVDAIKGLFLFAGQRSAPGSVMMAGGQTDDSRN